MADGDWSLREIPLRGLSREVDVVVLARILVEVSDPALGQRRRRAWAGSGRERGASCSLACMGILLGFLQILRLLLVLLLRLLLELCLLRLLGLLAGLRIVHKGRVPRVLQSW